jgi:hypothetical protein
MPVSTTAAPSDAEAELRSTLYMGLCVMIVLMGLVQYMTASKAESSAELASPEFQGFQRNYLAVYCFMVAGDWLQGPYVYHLYDYYGWSISDIGVLFIAGFGSSMAFGTFIGSAVSVRVTPFSSSRAGAPRDTRHVNGL